MGSNAAGHRVIRGVLSFLHPAAQLTPDVPAPETLADYVAGRDAAVAAAVAWQP